jgi:hypothetical protein
MDTKNCRSKLKSNPMSGSQAPARVKDQEEHAKRTKTSQMED